MGGPIVERVTPTLGVCVAVFAEQPLLLAHVVHRVANAVIRAGPTAARAICRVVAVGEAERRVAGVPGHTVAGGVVAHLASATLVVAPAGLRARIHAATVPISTAIRNTAVCHDPAIPIVTAVLWTGREREQRQHQT